MNHPGVGVDLSRKAGAVEKGMAVLDATGLL
jgi:hypothetical protein